MKKQNKISKTLILIILLIPIVSSCSSYSGEEILFLPSENMHYAQTSYHNETDALMIDLITIDVYENVTGLHIDYSEGIITNGIAEITKDGIYHLSGSVSFYGGNSGTYRYNLFVNDVEEHGCGAMRTTTTSSIGSLSMNCLVTLYSGDTVNMRIKDTTSPVQDVGIYTLTFNMVQI